MLSIFLPAGDHMHLIFGNQREVSLNSNIRSALDPQVCVEAFNIVVRPAERTPSDSVTGSAIQIYRCSAAREHTAPAICSIATELFFVNLLSQLGIWNIYFRSNEQCNKYLEIWLMSFIIVMIPNP